MNDEQLELIIKAFKLNGNDFELNTKSFSIKSDHNLFSISFLVNNDFYIYRNKGEKEDIHVNKMIDINKLIEEIKEIIECKSQQNV